jgi:hypothetical protein
MGNILYLFALVKKVVEKENIITIKVNREIFSLLAFLIALLACSYLREESSS